MNRLHTLKEEVDKIIHGFPEKNERFFFSHLYSVCDYCIIIAIRRNLNVELAGACGLLHDIGELYTEDSKEHTELGAIVSEKILKSINVFNYEEIDTILKAIRKHSQKNTYDGPYEEVLKDADVMYHCLFDPGDLIREKDLRRYLKLLREFGCDLDLAKLYLKTGDDS